MRRHALEPRRGECRPPTPHIKEGCERHNHGEQTAKSSKSPPRHGVRDGSGLSGGFSAADLQAARDQREVSLTTTGRRSGKARRVTIWIATDGEHIYVRSGQGMGRQWPQNLMANGKATLRLGGRVVEVRPRHVTDPDEVRRTSQLAREKYGSYVKPSKPGEPLTMGETAVFELIPA